MIYRSKINRIQTDKQQIMSVKSYFDECREKYAEAAREYLAQHPRNGKYRISCRAFDEDLQRYLDSVPVAIELSDDEYVAVLVEMLSVRYNVTFNSILFSQPAIAKRINDQAIRAMEEHEMQNLCPFMILLDEFKHDRWQMSEIPEDDF